MKIKNYLAVAFSLVNFANFSFSQNFDLNKKIEQIIKITKSKLKGEVTEIRNNYCIVNDANKNIFNHFSKNGTPGYSWHYTTNIVVAKDMNTIYLFEHPVSFNSTKDGLIPLTEDNYELILTKKNKIEGKLYNFKTSKDLKKRSFYHEEFSQFYNKIIYFVKKNKKNNIWKGNNHYFSDCPTF